MGSKFTQLNNLIQIANEPSTTVTMFNEPSLLESTVTVCQSSGAIVAPTHRACLALAYGFIERRSTLAPLITHQLVQQPATMPTFYNRAQYGGWRQLVILKLVHKFTTRDDIGALKNNKERETPSTATPFSATTSTPQKSPLKKTKNINFRLFIPPC